MLKLVRGIHISGINLSSKAQLLKLRKKTGYPFNSCKKALELNDYSLEKSELWLNEEAKRLGWKMANKLASRVTVQGLVALATDKLQESATLIEVNCETDFVTRNKYFHSIVEEVASSCLEFAKKQKPSENTFSKVNLESDQLLSLISCKGQKLADCVAVTIGNLGENIILKRATCINTKDTDLIIKGLTHPCDTIGSNLLCGKYGSIIIYQKQQNNGNINNAFDEKILGQMCQHVIGMNPKCVGIYDTLKPNITEEQDDNINFSMDEVKSEVDDNQMLNQLFLLDSSMTVGQVANDYNIKIIDFIRYECGEI